MLSATRAYFAPFLEISLLRKPPQNIPQSSRLLQSSLIMYVVLGIINASLHHSLVNAIFIALVDLLMLFVLLYLWLMIFGLQNRWMQTVTALCGAGCIIGLIAIPVSLLGQQDWSSSGLVIMIFLQVFLFVWNISLYSYVFKHAFSTHIMVAACMAVFYYLFFLSLISMLIVEVAES